MKSKVRTPRGVRQILDAMAGKKPRVRKPSPTQIHSRIAELELQIANLKRQLPQVLSKPTIRLFPPLMLGRPSKPAAPAAIRYPQYDNPAPPNTNHDFQRCAFMAVDKGGCGHSRVYHRSEEFAYHQRGGGVIGTVPNSQGMVWVLPTHDFVEPSSVLA